MSRWRSAVVAPFVSGIARVTVVADPDALLDDASVLHTLSARGFTVLTYSDPLAFRLLWETQWRDGWAAGATDEVVVRVVGDERARDELPYDVLRDARRLVLDRGTAFPDLPRRVLVSLGGRDLDWLDTRPARDVVMAYGARVSHMDGVLDGLEQGLPDSDAGHGAWTDYAGRWAEALALRHADGRAPTPWHDRFEALHDRIEARFGAWMVEHFSALASLSPSSPVMVHHVPRAMARALERGTARRVALLVLDGMAYDQWLTLRATLDVAAMGATEQRGAVFAWVPTITSVSRQSLFAGAVPARFATQLGGTSGEAGLWRAFWRAERLRDEAVVYKRGLGSSGGEALDAQLEDPRVRVLGLVADTVDAMLHGAVLGAAGMHEQLRLWARDGWLSRTLGSLIAHGFTVFVTADHGNLELTGTGRVVDGALAEVRGERVRVFADEPLRQKVARQHPMARCWRGEGLPAEYKCLLATGRDAFVEPGRKLLGHGSIALEEVVVPLVVFAPTR